MKLSTGRITTADEAILSLFTFDPETREWTCLGTGFFFHNKGGFITAKHCVMDESGNHVKTLYGVQTTSSGERHLRVVVRLENHPSVDISIGMLGYRREDGIDLPPEDTIPFVLNFDALQGGDKIRSYAFPQTKHEPVENNGKIFTIQGKWMEGEILDYREEGTTKVTNRIYFTSMNVEGGASGGPVIKDSRVVGINSSGYGADISVMTPIDYILDMEVSEGDGERVSILHLIERGNIHVRDFPNS